MMAYKLNVWKAMLSGILVCGLLSLFAAPFASAQQRTFFNGGFEQNNPGDPMNTNPTFEILDDNLVDEWTSTTDEIELWDSGFLNTPSYEGDVHAEMNANIPGTLFQEVCLINDEEIEWFFAHRARPGGPGINPQSAVLEIAELANSNTVVQPLATQTTLVNQAWQTNTGSTNFTGATGVYRVQFRSISPGSFGNFIDALTLNISSFAVLSSNSGESLEIVGSNIPTVTVNGLVDVDTTIPVNITGGTATAGDDFTQTSPTLLIPAGLHFNAEFPLPIVINDNSVVEPDETIEIELGTPSTPEVIYENTVCDGTPAVTSATYTILNDDTTVKAEKTVAPYDPDGTTEYSIPGNDVIYTISIENTGPVDVDSGTIFLVDALPDEITFFNGDIDDGGPEVGPTSATSSDGSLSLTYPTDVLFSTDAAAPTDISDCDDTPAVGYDPDIRYICFTPQGSLTAGEAFSVSFRTRIN